MQTPLPHLLGDGFNRLDARTPASGLGTFTPGLSVDAPLIPPRPGSALPGWDSTRTGNSRSAAALRAAADLL
ncbi:hypothetical protein [Streptomyces sp. NPDC001530]|uniref:hypothetical protein n=1 Tax=Streptomyces sp. NPDC001530 TaxID=3364582 RepID=UPI003699E7B8